MRSFSRGVLNMWALSVCLAHRWLGQVEIYGDELTQEVLKKLRLPIADWHDLDVSMELSHLPLYGKNRAHQLCAEEGEPYAMLDYDLFLWRKPDDAVLNAPAFAQIQEKTNVPVNAVLDKLQLLNPTITIPRYPFACNAGISGGNDMETLQKWTRLCRQLAEDPRNRPALILGDGWVPASAFDESLYLAHFGERMAFLMPPLSGLDDAHKYEAAGFTHLAGPLKHEPIRQLQVETRLGLLFPEAYERVQRVWFDDVARR